MSTRIKLNVKNITTSFQNFSDVLGHESKIHNGFSCLVVPRSIPLRRPDCKYYKQDYVRRNNLDYARLALTPAPGSRSLKRIASDIPLPGKWLDTVHMIPGTPGRTRPWQSSYSFYYDKKNPQCPPPSPKVEVEEKEPDDPNVVDCTCPDPCPDTSGCSDAPRPQVRIIPAYIPCKDGSWESTCSFFYDTQSLQYSSGTPKLDVKEFDKKPISCPDASQQQVKIENSCEEEFKHNTSLFYRKKCTFVVPLNFYRRFSSKCPKKGGRPDDPDKVCRSKPRPVQIRKKRHSAWGPKKKVKVCTSKGRKGRKKKGKGPAYHFQTIIKDYPAVKSKTEAKPLYRPVCPPKKKKRVLQKKDCCPKGDKRRKLCARKKTRKLSSKGRWKSSLGPTCPRKKGRKPCVRKCVKRSTKVVRKYPCAGVYKSKVKKGKKRGSKKRCRAFIRSSGRPAKKKKQMTDYCGRKSKNGKPKCKK
ncbi:hypothetical protein B5X24_HaOG214925 [Helicoverpa armigera]|nr:hypothetical protein B5X24_HaOG214925 [Helicoverpa armigera]